MTISEANSMPGVRRSSFGRMSRRRPRMPQCASRTPVRKKRLRMPERIGLPTYWCSHGIAPGWMLSIRSPMTSSAPPASSSTNRGMSSKGT